MHLLWDVNRVFDSYYLAWYYLASSRHFAPYHRHLRQMSAKGSRCYPGRSLCFIVEYWYLRAVLIAISLVGPLHHLLRQPLGLAGIRWLGVKRCYYWSFQGKLNSEQGAGAHWYQHLPPLPEQSARQYVYPKNQRLDTSLFVRGWVAFLHGDSLR